MLLCCLLHQPSRVRDHSLSSLVGARPPGLDTDTLNEGTFFFVHEAIVPMEFLHGLRLRLKQPSRWQVWNIIVQHAFDFMTNNTIAKDLAMLVRVMRKIIKKTLRLCVTAIISTYFYQPEFSEGQLRPVRIELVPHSARNDKVPTSHSQGQYTFSDPRRFRRSVLHSHRRH